LSVVWGAQFRDAASAPQILQLGKEGSGDVEIESSLLGEFIIGGGVMDHAGELALPASVFLSWEMTVDTAGV